MKLINIPRDFIANIFILLITIPMFSQAETPVYDKTAETAKPVQEKGVFTPNFTYLNTSLNYLDWSNGTVERVNGTKDDFVYLELEGGGGFDWGDVYFFVDIENPTKGWHEDAPDNTRLVAKPIFDITIADSPWAIHIQSYYLKEDTFYVNNLVVGLSYKYANDDGFWIRPFFGPHQQESTYYDGMNGYMTGWVFGYDFAVNGYDFSISQWHEYEFDRDEEHYKFTDEFGVEHRTGDGKSTGTNGALAIWWKINDDLTAGYQYRYANSKLGSIEYQTANIFTLKYNL